jgi:hypothetical protein
VSGPPSVAGLLAAILEGQNRLRAEVAEVRALLERRAPAPDAAVEALLRAIAKYAPDRAFTTAELVVHAGKVPELRGAVVAVVGGLNARKIGRAFRRVEGVNLGGLTVVRIGDDGAGVIWCVKRVSEA